MKHYILLLLLFATNFTIVAQNTMITIRPTKQVGIYITGDINQGYKKVIGAKMVSSITQSKEYVAVERTADFLSTLAREQDYQISGMVSDNQIAKIGAQFGVQYVIAADASEVFGSIFISARMINVESAQIIASTESELKVNSMDALMNLAIDVSESLMGELLHPGLLNKVEVVGPIRTTSQMPQNGIPTFHLNEIKHIAKTLSKKGQIRYPVLIDVKLTYSTNLTTWTIELLNSDNSISSIVAHVNVFDNNQGSLQVRHSDFPTPFYIFKNIQ